MAKRVSLEDTCGLNDMFAYVDAEKPTSRKRSMDGKRVAGDGDPYGAEAADDERYIKAETPTPPP